MLVVIHIAGEVLQPEIQRVLAFAFYLQTAGKADPRQIRAIVRPDGRLVELLVDTGHAR
ncbi:MAG: hypothetical protein IPH87_11175 [Anaerolineae bacterium]|nr:hypothetical protein [Anaerolineae bacterium]